MAKQQTGLVEGVIVSVDNEPKGWDDTFFRVIKSVINVKEIEYIVEDSRDSKSWFQILHVSFNRLSVHVVNWLLTEHGGTSHQCRMDAPKI
ncbi:TPA: hypothetical protein OTQ49_000881 [Raoultella ornithinolytica]|nr:hypothetical protein [Raoultella ornithinolytica]HDH7815482.1 hypothetical protein [Raoultella ornithinolytica]